MDRAIPVKRFTITGGLLMVVLFLSGCDTLLNFSPDRAAVQAIVTSRSPSQEIHHDTIRVLQTQESSPGIVVLTTYLATQENDQMLECLALFNSEKFSQGWQAFGLGTTCWEVTLEDPNPISIGMLQNASLDTKMSYAIGLVFDPDIKLLDITWDDTFSQRIEVIKNSYLAIRAGQSSVASILAYDTKEDLVYTYQNPSLKEGDGN